jgi:predicted phage tail protein
MRSVTLFRRAIGVLAIALGLFFIGFAIWLFRDTAGPARRMLVGSGILMGVLATLGTVGISMVLEGVSLLLQKADRASASAGERKADK